MISTSRNIKLQKSYLILLWTSNFGVFSLTLRTLKSHFSESVQDIKLRFSGFSCLIYCNNFVSFYQILRLVMSKCQKVCTIWCGMTHRLVETGTYQTWKLVPYIIRVTTETRQIIIVVHCSRYHWNQNWSKAKNNCSSLQ